MKKITSCDPEKVAPWTFNYECYAFFRHFRCVKAIRRKYAHHPFFFRPSPFVREKVPRGKRRRALLPPRGRNFASSHSYRVLTTGITAAVHEIIRFPLWREIFILAPCVAGMLPGFFKEWNFRKSQMIILGDKIRRDQCRIYVDLWYLYRFTSNYHGIDEDP